MPFDQKNEITEYYTVQRTEINIWTNEEHYFKRVIWVVGATPVGTASVCAQPSLLMRRSVTGGESTYDGGLRRCAVRHVTCTETM